MSVVLADACAQRRIRRGPTARQMVPVVARQLLHVTIELVMGINDKAETKAVPAGSTPAASGVETDELDVRESKQELFLPVHGHVELFTEEIAIIDHPAFQRLRRVRQLGMAHMVFPGATHNRFEHSVGAVHVAKLIVDHVNANSEKSRDRFSQWTMAKINQPTTRFIRLAALLHDVGHLPFGHTLEDELNHLRSHDGPERLERVSAVEYPNHEVDLEIVPADERPGSGWTLKALVNRLYKRHAEALPITSVDPFTVLSHIICKPPKDDGKKEAWDEVDERLRGQFMLGVCRDIVGNTICADFLDYIHRDWYHLGKPLYYDMRLYQYMEVRRRGTAVGNGEAQFFINVGASSKIRHDALTDILELLNARYKLAETVLFHRTKLALTGLLDRCILEIEELYRQAGLPATKFIDVAEGLLLDASDDGLPRILGELAAGGDALGKEHLSETIEKERQQIEEAVEKGKGRGAVGTAGTSARSFDFPDTVARAIGDIEAQHRLALQLIDRLRDREVYTLVYKLRMSDLTGAHYPDNPRLIELLKTYKDPKKRLEFLRGMEALCELPPGSLIMNCPSDAAMNAKVAQVKLFIEGDVNPFDKYEDRQGDASLTRGALWAQIKRFYELWAASIYVDPREWDRRSAAEREHLRSVLQLFFFRMEGDTNPKIIRMQAQPSIEKLSTRAAQKDTPDPRKQALRGFVFPSGIPFDLE
jgi:HD superfamily phosphohydrolase